jgi:hypothetical protein
MKSIYLEIANTGYEFKVMPLHYIEINNCMQDSKILISREEWELQGCE